MKWSLLDASLRGPGPLRLPQDVARAAAALPDHARQAEELGMHRYWLAEHHVPGAPHPCPSFSMIRAAEATTTLRIGAGCILALYRTPMQIAELGRYLASLYPGRVDFAMGPGPGASEDSRHRLGWLPDPGRRAAALDSTYREVLHDLQAPPARLPGNLQAWPESPLPWIVGASRTAATVAGHLGAAFAVGWIKPDFETARKAGAALEAHKELAADKSRMLVVDISQPFAGIDNILVVGRGDGGSVQIHGDPDTAREHLLQLGHEAGVDEVMLAPRHLGGRVGCELLEWLLGGDRGVHVLDTIAPRQTASAY